MNDTDTLITALKAQIISSLKLSDVKPDDIDADDPLVGGGLGLDSIDTLELVVMMEKDYGVKIDTRAAGIEAFASLNALAAYIRQHRSASSP